MPVAKDEFDVGPLSWVKPEIELALQRADEGITRFGLTPGDRGIARSTLTHLHQVSGALLMVGLEPVARVSEAMEKLVEALDRGDIQMGPQITGAVHGAITALNQYLEGLMRGEPNRPLMLLPAYHGIVAAGGADKANEVDLFYPDLSRRPKFSETHTPRAREEQAALLNLKRAEFQRGLLNLLRGNEVAESLRAMRTALSTIEAMQPASTRLLWWIAVGFLEGLAQSSVVPEVFHKQLCGRIDLQIKRQAEGADTVSERLMRELLFAIAKMQPVTERVREIQETYRLTQLMPQSTQENPETTRVRLLLHEVKDQLESIKESWLKFTSGNRACLHQFVEQTTGLNILAQNLGNPAFQTVFATLAEVGADLAAHPRDAGEALALETATTLLMAKDSAENYYRLGPNFKNLAETAVARLMAALKGIPMPGEGAAQLADVARAAQEKLLFFQLGKEIFTNLNHIEQLLDAFFRDPAKRADLSLLPDYINQVQGAFAMLESKDAENLLNASLALVQKFLAGDGSADPKDADLTAEAFSNLGLYVSALQQGHENPDELLHPVLARFNIAPTRPVAPLEQEPEVAGRAIEQDLDGQKRSMAGLFERWQRDPQAAHRAALTDALSAIRQDAQLAGQTTLADQATRALALIGDSSASAALVRETFLAMLGSNLLPAPEPVKPVGVVEPAAAEIDAELLEIFLEEAAEVLGGIAIHRDVAMVNPSDREALIVIRRGFHTLKGSGRMVGLTEMGEVAWQVEQVMNKWLRDEKAATKGLLRLIGDAHHSFSNWIETLHTGSQPDVAAPHIFNLADQLKNDQEPTEESTPLSMDSVAASALSDSSAAAESAISESATSAALVIERESEPPRKINVGDVSLDADFFEIFANESQLHRATLLDHLASLRSDPAQPVTHEFMRAAHTLMGISRTSNIAPMADLGFGVEQWLLDRLDHPAPLGADDLALTIEAVETLANMVIEVSEQRAPLAEPMLTERLSQRLRLIRAERREQEGLSAVAMDAVAMQPAPSIVPTPPVVATAPTASAVMTPFITKGSPEPQATTVVRPTDASISTSETGKERRRTMSDDIDEQLLPLFLEEASDLIPEIGETLRHWRASPSDAAPAALLGRHLHTLKGSARMAGVMRLGELSHTLENQVVAMQDAAHPSEANFDSLEDGFDRFTAALERLKAGERAEEEIATEASETEAIATVAKSPASTRARAPAAVVEVSQLAAAQQVDEGRPVLRVRADLVDRFVNDAGEISIARSRIEGEMTAFRVGLSELTQNVIKLRAQLREIEIQAESQIQSSTQHLQEAGETFDPLEFDRFTRMQELSRFMAESVNDFVTLQQSLTKNLDETDAALAAQSRLNRELQQNLMSVRMVPLGNLADRLYRVVRQTAKELGKKANLEFKGMRTELDRGVLEKIVAPFEHLLRNAIAHGIESPEAREAAGKSAIGEITIDAQQQANEIVLTFSDDGDGINIERVREKARQSGLVVNEEMTEAQLVQQIFVPGFSTATEITQVAGRGVGLDVVKNAIVTLGGRIEVDTVRGRGTTFIITLPLTLAVTQAVLVRANGMLYAIPSVMVEQVQEWKLPQITDLRAKKEIVWQDHPYPFYPLSNLLGEEEKIAEPRRYHPVMLLRSAAQRVAVEVESIEGNREIVVKSIGPQLSRLTGIAGATVLGNGKVLLILNPVSLAAREHGGVLVRTETVAETTARAPLIMVVDDSLTVRKITTRLLTREGYQVITAKDGVDALQQLQELTPDAMLLDIEMPRMDGFELTRNMRADPKMAGIPIIMITSRMAEKHRNFAFELGVNEYMGKPFQEEELLRHLVRYVGQAAAA